MEEICGIYSFGKKNIYRQKNDGKTEVLGEKPSG